MKNVWGAALRGGMMLLYGAALAGMGGGADAQAGVTPFQAEGQTAAQENKKENAMPIGVFEDRQDVGVVLHPGSAAFDARAGAYTVTGSGENIWAVKDAFQYVWKKVTGDIALSADIAFVGAGHDPHRKACLMIRQSLDADAAYADVALHGDGLTSLQFRATRGGLTHEVQANVAKPAHLRIEKRGKNVRMYLSADANPLHFSGGAVQMTFEEPFYIGLALSSHNKDVTEQAVFTNVTLDTALPAASGQPTLYSTLETQAIASTDRRVAFVTPTHIEAPNWLHDGNALIYNSGGRLYRLPVKNGTPTVIDTGFAIRCNNDHGVSPDGTKLVISDQSQTGGQSLIYTLPVEGGTPHLVTSSAPSYWHGWSPDGKTLAYCAQRDGKFGIFTILAAGGHETRLTTAQNLDDGPEYSPDGKYIYFNSDRAGKMQIWRMGADGSAPEQVVHSDDNDWFPHLSPDGKNMVFLSYDKEVSGHPANKDVTLRLMNLDTKKITFLGSVFGGQGTINVPCWSPDSKQIAFVTYQLLP